MTNLQPITSNMYLSQQQKPTRTTGNGTLGKDEFLKILMTQLQNQDPTNPMEDTEFISQMAQFSSLEQMTNMTKAFEKFADAQTQTQLIQYSNFVGKEIKWHEITDKKNEKGDFIIEEGTDKIAAVKFVEGGAEFTLASGKVIAPGNISEVITSGTSSNSLVEASLMIGRNIEYSGNNSAASGVVESVSKKEGKIVYNLSDGTAVSAEQITSIK